ncbi:MAG: ornithine cyclodeaminase family protein, partial [Gemmatimonadota bacterium]
LQLEALAVVRDFRRVRIWNRTPARAEACAREVADAYGVAAAVAASVEAAVRDADVVLTVTPSREPLVRAEWLASGVHVTAVGSDAPEKQELDVSVLARADVVVADRLAQCLRLGEIHHAVEAGALDPATAVELGDIVAGTARGRTQDAQITVCDLTGVGVQDAAIAALAVERARALGLGRELDA